MKSSTQLSHGWKTVLTSLWGSGGAREGLLIDRSRSQHSPGPGQEDPSRALIAKNYGVESLRLKQPSLP
jgi:hypothetical protein